MPGLLGIVDGHDKLGPEKIRRELTRMAESLYQEPDYVTEIETGRRFGVARVGRPQHSAFAATDADRRGTVYFSGELYSLSGRDVLGDEVGGELAGRLLDDPVGALANSDGSFSLAWHDAERRSLRLATDCVATHPVYVTEQAGVLYFAPEVKALLPALESPAVDRASIAHMLVVGMTYLDKTLFESVRLLPPGAMVSVDLERGAVEETRYWTFAFEERPRDRGVAAFSEELNALIDAAVRRRVRDRDARRVAVSLSGGFDSRAVLGPCLARNVDLLTVTHGVPTDKPATDMALAPELARHYGLRHRTYPYDPAGMIDHLDDMIRLSDGQTDQLDNYPEGLRVLHKTREEADVLLRGDELFGWKGGVFNEEDALACFGPTRLPDRFGDVLRPAVHAEMRGHALDGLKLLSDASPQQRLIDMKDWIVFHQGMPNFWGKLNYLKRAAIDIRAPLLDREILEFMMRLPFRHRMYRSLFRKACFRGHPELFSHPMAQSHNLANWSSIYRGQGRLKSFLEDKLLADRHPFFDGLVDAARVGDLIDFVNNRRKEACAASPSAKAYQGLSTAGRLKAFKPKALLAQSIMSNPVMYRLALPFLRGKEVRIGWFKDDDLLMRLIVIKRWSDMFLA